MSQRKTDELNNSHFSSDRYFFADGKWHYYIRTYDNTIKTISGFNSKEEAEQSCSARFSNKIDMYFYHNETGTKK